MKKNYKKILLIVAVFTSGLITAQSKLVHWISANTSTQSYPQSGSALNAAITSANQNYSGLIPVNDGRNVWDNQNSDATVNPSASPYLSYTLITNTSIDFDRFVINGAAPFNSNIKMQLRWSVDSFASSLGDFTPGDSSYNLTSVDISSASTVPAGSVEFRIYYYAANTWIFHASPGSYTSLDATPSTYANAGSFSVWGSTGTLSVNSINTIKPSLSLYPNPSTNYIKISGLKKGVKFSLVNTLGAKVQVGTVYNNQELSVKNLVKGLYFLELETGETLKFVKK